ncbi:MAG: alpha/beta hydrolase, partial [Bacteroidota bacterium]
MKVPAIDLPTHSRIRLGSQTTPHPCFGRAKAWLVLLGFTLGWACPAWTQPPPYGGSFFEVEGHQVHYVQKGEGPPLLLLHGGGTWLYSWRNVIDSLALYFTVLAVDLPGHGYTVSEAPQYSLDDYSAFISQVLNHLGWERATLMGNSWGGGWALHFAQQYPERVSALVLLAPAGLDRPDVPDWEILKYPVLGELSTLFLTRGLVRTSYEKLYRCPGALTPEVVEYTYQAMVIPQNRKAMYRIKRQCDWSVTEQALEDVACPTLVLWGDADAYNPVEYAEEFGRQIPKAKVVIG